MLHKTPFVATGEGTGEDLEGNAGPVRKLKRASCLSHMYEMARIISAQAPMPGPQGRESPRW